MVFTTSRGGDAYGRDAARTVERTLQYEKPIRTRSDKPTTSRSSGRCGGLDKQPTPAERGQRRRDLSLQ